MKILFAGTTAQAARVLHHLATRITVVAVLTREDAPVGRKGQLQESPVAAMAGELGLSVIRVNRVTPDIDALIEHTDAEFGVVVAYGALLKSSTLKLLPGGWFNLHYSLLPAYRGAAPVQHALLNAERTTGVTIFKLDEGMDTGEIYSQVETTIEPGENSLDLLERLTSIGITMLDELLPGLAAGTAKGTVQPAGGSLAGKLVRADARLDFNRPATALEHMVRAFNPEPVAWCEHGEAQLRILDARAELQSLDGQVGTCILVGGRVFVKCAQQALELLEVQPAGKRPMNAADWLRGQRDGEVLR